MRERAKTEFQLILNEIFNKGAENIKIHFQLY